MSAPDGIHALTMPKWGLSMEEGTLAEWLADAGSAVAKGDEVVYIETSKIAGAVEVSVPGTLRRHVAQVGDVLPVGALLGVIADPSVDDAAIDAFVAEFQENFVPEERGGDLVDAEPDRVDLSGRSVAYRKTPAAQSARGLPALLIHGFGGDSKGWLFNQDRLANGRDVYALDLPGHGVSSKDVGEGTVAAMAEVVEEFLAALEIEKAHLVGHSLGGAVALAMAVASSPRIVSVTTLGACGYGEYINTDFIEGYVRAGRRKEMKPILEMLFAAEGLVTRDMVNDVLKYKRIDGVPEALAVIAAASFPGGKQGARFRERMSDLSVPILALWGSEDRIVDPLDGKDLPGNIQVHLIEGAGHMPHMEAATAVNDLLDGHFRSAD